MSTLNGQNNDHDQLLHAIEQIVQGEANTTHDPRSALGVGARLAATVPQPDTAFADQLEARLVAAAEQRKEATMSIIESQHTPNERRSGTSSPRKRFYPAVRFAAVAATALVLMIGLVAAVPPARAAVENFMQRFGLVLVDTSELRDSETALAQATAQATPPPMSLAEAQQQVPFLIRMPTWIPDGVQFVKVDTATSTEVEGAPLIEAYVWYGRAGTTEPEVMLEMSTRPDIAPVFLPASREQIVQVHQFDATYIHGGWRSDGLGDPNEAVGDLRWDDKLDSAWLSWKEDELTYTLLVHSLDLSREDVIRIAESLQ